MFLEEQENALAVLKSGQNTALLGKAGTGKTHVLREYISYAKEKELNVVICAPTGIAAIAIGGETIHRLFKVPVKPLSPEEPLEANKVIDFADIIIIDEIGMCRFDVFNYLARVIQKSEEKTGKCKQLVVVGDFFQLPPVIGKEDRAILEELWGIDSVNNGFAFQAPMWEKFMFCNVSLTKTVRQNNESDLVEYLNEIHDGKKEAAEWFNRNAAQDMQDGITLCGRKNTVEEINKMESEKLSGKSCVYSATITGDVKNDDMMTEQELSLKVGMRVMSVVNDIHGKYQNGSMGKILAIRNDFVCVQFDNGHWDFIYPYTWNINHYHVEGRRVVTECTGTYKQIPLRVAFACTIHKAQGATFDKVNLYPECFAPGQLYVALSRVRTIDGLHLCKPIKGSDVITAPEVEDFYQSF